jgi:hypothetical protein
MGCLCPVQFDQIEHGDAFVPFSSTKIKHGMPLSRSVRLRLNTLLQVSAPLNILELLLIVILILIFDFLMCTGTRGSVAVKTLEACDSWVCWALRLCIFH